MTQSKSKSNNQSIFKGLMHYSQSKKVILCIFLVFFFCGMTTVYDVPIKLGNPVLARFPTSGDPRNSLARTIWDMYYFNGRIYIGSGDYWNNSGASDIWTYDGIRFTKDFTVDDEMVYNFFEFDNKLFIPGNDSTESWDFANIYINVPGTGWIKRRSLPKGLHSWDCCFFKNKLYASISNAELGSSTLVSVDLGENFTEFISDKTTKMVAFDNIMFLEAYDNTYYKFDGTTLTKITPNLYPNYTLTKSMDRNIRFSDGVLYIPARGFGRLKVDEKIPLFFLPESEIKNGGVATKVAKFTNDIVRDIVVRGPTCYVMTASEIKRDVSYKGVIYSSTDLINWSIKTEFIVSGLPTSFEIMNKKYYVGLGARLTGFEPKTVGLESGSIWEITPLPTTGTASFTSTPPGATLVLDGTNRGITPLTLTLSPASYTATFSLTGYQSESKSFGITAGTDTPIHADLTPLPDFSKQVVIIKLAIGSNIAAITRNGKMEYSTLDLPPFTQNERTMVPLRLIAESFGAKLHWIEDSNDSGEGTIIINLNKSDGYKIKMKMHTNEKTVIIEQFTPNSSNPVINQYVMDVAPFIVRSANRTVVPIRFIAEGFGSIVIWHPEKKEIEIKYIT